MKILPRTLRQKLMTELQRSYLDFQLPGILQIPMSLLEQWLFERDLESLPIDRPIFIVGCHRSGTTALQDLLAHHPDIVCFNNSTAFLPHSGCLTYTLGRVLGLDDVEQERFLKDGVGYAYDSPSEGIRIWDLYIADRDTHYLDESHDDPEMEQYLKTMIRKHLRYFNKSRFLSKNPDHSVRMRYIHKLFPDARFVHIVRDGRAVAASLIRAKQSSIEFFGPDHPHVQHGTMVANWREIKRIWEEDNAAVGAGMLWRAVLEVLIQDVQQIPADQFLQIHYEDMVASPRSHIDQILEFCQLRQDQEVEQALKTDIEKMEARRGSEGWRKAFTDQDLDRLMPVVEPMMMKLSYSV